MEVYLLAVSAFLAFHTWYSYTLFPLAFSVARKNEKYKLWVVCITTLKRMRILLAKKRTDTELLIFSKALLPFWVLAHRIPLLLMIVAISQPLESADLPSNFGPTPYKVCHLWQVIISECLIFKMNILCIL